MNMMYVAGAIAVAGVIGAVSLFQNPEYNLEKLCENRDPFSYQGSTSAQRYYDGGCLNYLERQGIHRYLFFVPDGPNSNKGVLISKVSGGGFKKAMAIDNRSGSKLSDLDYKIIGPDSEGIKMEEIKKIGHSIAKFYLEQLEKHGKNAN